MCGESVDAKGSERVEQRGFGCVDAAAAVRILDAQSVRAMKVCADKAQWHSPSAVFQSGWRVQVRDDAGWVGRLNEKWQ